MSRFRCFDTYNLQNTSSSDYTTVRKRQTIFTEYQTIAIGNVNFQKGLTENVIPPGYLRKDNGAYYYGPVYVTTDDIAVNNCLIGAKNYELLYDMLFAAQPSPDDIKNISVTYSGEAWQGNLFKTDFKDIGTIGPAITNTPDGSVNKMNYAARQDFLPKYDDIPNPPNEFPGIIIDPCYNIFYPRCNTTDQANNYVKNVKFNFSAAQLENSEVVNYIRKSSSLQYKAFPYQLNFQNTTCKKYPFEFIFSFTNISDKTPDEILASYMPILNPNKTISYDIEYIVDGVNGEFLTYIIKFKYTGAPSPIDGLTFHPQDDISNNIVNNDLVNFYNQNTTDFTIKSFDLIPLSPLGGGQFRNLNFTLSASNIPLIKSDTNLDNAFRGTDVTIIGDGTANWRTSGVVSMNSTFRDSNFNGELNDWNTVNVTDMRSIFENNTSFNQPINKWNIRGITDMSRMFYGASAFNQPLNNWTTIQITNMRNVFTGAYTFNQSLNSWNTKFVTDMSGMFMDASGFNGNIRTWDTQLVTTMNSMFRNAENFNQNISYDQPNNYWNTTNVNNFDYVLADTINFNNGQPPLPGLNAGFTNPLGWTNSTPIIFQTAINPVFNSAGLTIANAVPFSKPASFVYEFYDSIGYTAADICSNYLPVIINGSSTIRDVSIIPSDASANRYKTVSFSLIYNGSDINSGLSFNSPGDQKVNFYNTTGNGNPIRIIDFDYIPLAKNGYQFYNLHNLDISNSIPLTRPSIFPSTQLNNAFNQAYNFNSSNLSSWNVTNVINMDSVFKDSSFNQDISEWNTINVTNMSSMFENNVDFSQNLSKWNTSKVTNMSSMFKNATSFNSKIIYDTITDPSNIYWDVSSVLNMSSMFENATGFNNGQGPGGIDQSLNWILNPLVNLTSVRTGASILTNDNALPLPSFYTLVYDFFNIPPQTTVDISNNVPILTLGQSSIISTTVSPQIVNYRTVSTTASFPNHIQDLSSGISFINVYPFFNTNTASPHRITQFGGMRLARNNNDSVNPNGYQFADLSLCTLEFSANDAPAILPNTTLSYCFYNSSTFDSSFNNWNTSEVTSMASMFENTTSFDQSLNILTNKVTNMSNMFKNATSFNQYISYVGGPYWDVSGVTNMISIFENASAFNNGFPVLDTMHPLDWILNFNVNTTNCIKNATILTFQNAYPLAQIYDRFTYTFYNTQNISIQDISDSYLPIIKTSDLNLDYYYPPTITINPLDNNFTTVTVYFRYNDVSLNVIDGLSFYDVSSTYNSNTLAKTITNFGNIPLARNNGLTSGSQFMGINNLVFNSPSTPTILPDTTFEQIFKDSIFNSIINNWDVSEVNSLNQAFADTLYNQSLNGWNTSNVTDMSGVFYNDIAFNNSLNEWNVSNVNTMTNMFYNCQLFNQDISGWQTSNLEKVDGMFDNCLKFNQYLSNWDMSGVTTMNNLFNNCFDFNNGDTLGSSNYPLTWNTDSVTILSNVFKDAISFNQDISGWNTGNVTTMSNMFNEAISFNKPLELWDVSNVTTMSYMFYGSNFDQDISGWNTSSLKNMESMFQNDVSFNQRISYLPDKSTSAWNTENVTNMISVFEGALVFNNGQDEGETDQSLNWILNTDPGVVTNRVIQNTPLLTSYNALPFSKIIKGTFSYTFYNTNSATFEDISNNYLPIYDACNNFILNVPPIITPDLIDPSFIRIDISYTFLDISNNTLDGLTFYSPGNVKTTFYNDTQNRLTIIGFDDVPISRNSGTDGGYQFANLSYLDISVNQFDKPSILTDTSFDHAFYNTPSFNSGNIQNWDTIFVTTMESMFEDSSYNQPLRFNTKNITNMNSMFKNAVNFNQNISYNPSVSSNIWNVSNVTDMTEMLFRASSFNDGQSPGGVTRPLNWQLNPLVNITNVRRDTPVLTNQNAFPLPSLYILKYIFYDNVGFSGETILNTYAPIILNGKSSFYNTSVTPSTDTSGNKSVSIEFAYMIDNSNTGLSFYTNDNSKINFYNNNNGTPLKITQFGGIPLARNDGSITPNGYQFANLNHFDFSANDTPSILANTTLSYCFYNDFSFNSDISGWNTSNVISMESLFENASTFNRPLQPWNTSKVTDMSSMFKNAITFNQPVKYVPSSNYWDVSGVTDMTSIFENALTFNNGFPLFNIDNSLNWILNSSVNKTDSVKNANSLSDYNGLPLTTISSNEFVYKFYNTNNVDITNILESYLPFIKTNNLVFDPFRNITIVYGPSSQITLYILFTFVDDGTTLDGLTFNANPGIAQFYNDTQQPVEIIKFGGMPLSRYYNNKQQSEWFPVLGTTFTGSPSVNFGYSVTYGNGDTWIAVGGTQFGAPEKNTILRSTNNSGTWSIVGGTTFDGLGYAVFDSGVEWIAVGDDYGGTNTILKSVNYGSSWSPPLSGITFSYAGYGVYYYNQIWIAVGDDDGGPNTILTSTDSGDSWQPVTGAFTQAGFGVTFKDLDSGNGIWVAVGAGATSILYSNNGTSWSDCSGTLFSSYGQSVIYNTDIWVAIGNDNGGPNNILYSYNGIDWEPCTGTIMASYAQGLAFGGGRWVAVGYDNQNLNTIVYSDDGIIWNPVVGARFAFAGYGVSYDPYNNTWIAVGDNDGIVSTILTSIDGRIWVPTKGTNFDLVGYGVTNDNNGKWLSVGYDTSNNNILYSDSNL
jgi:surface protein